jgi:hypothetical protein
VISVLILPWFGGSEAREGEERRCIAMLIIGFSLPFSFFWLKVT